MADILTQDLMNEAEYSKGVFDNMLMAVEKSLDKQYRDSRITGGDYANVYLGSVQAVMQQSVAFLLGLREANAQAALLEAQTNLAVQELVKLGHDTNTAEQQALIAAAELLRVQAQTTLLGQQYATEIEETSKRNEETSLVTAQAALTAQQTLVETQKISLTTSQRLNIEEDTDLKTQQIATEVQSTNLAAAQISKTNSEKLRVDAETSLVEQKDLTEVQITARTTAEVDLTTYKATTEYTQTHDVRDDDSQAVGGVAGKQIALYQAQTDGFARDAEQKLSKILLDAWAVDASTNVTGLTGRPSNANDTAITTVLGQAIANIS